MNKYKVVAICGKSAAGKDTFLQEILKLNKGSFHEIVSCTTRPPREGEIHGKNYYFISEEQFHQLENDGAMLETTAFRDWFYGTCLQYLNPEKINLGVFNILGVKTLLANPNVDVYIIEIYASDKTRMLRSLSRESHPDVKEIVRRYSADEEDFKDFDTLPISSIVINEDNRPLDYAAHRVVEEMSCFWAKEAN